MRLSERVIGFVETMWDWFARHKRMLPWRDVQTEDETQRAYMILVSEVMLQQTQVSRVIIVFRNFLERYPKIEDLSRASNRDVLLAWRGMGYNSRALRLRDAARHIVDQFLVPRFFVARSIPAKQEPGTKERGTFPTSMDDLTAIPGIGHYTAAAVRNFAFNIPTPCLDTNIRRILHRTFFGPENADGTWRVGEKKLLTLAKEVLEQAVVRSCHPERSRTVNTLLAIPRDARHWHAALMDFGSLVQTKNNPKWDMCPLTRKGLMKTTSASFNRSRTYNLQPTTYNLRTEPGRTIAGKFVPNRIIRGRIVEELRDAEKGLLEAEIGGRVCVDWSPEEHREWLRGILEKLKKDVLIRSKGKRYLLAE